MLRPILLALALALTTTAQAAQLEPAQRLTASDWHSPGFALSRVEQAIELVRATRDISVTGYPGQTFPSDLRVSLLVLDNGPATDVSPLLDIHLAMFNEINEFGTAWAVEPVASVYAFNGVARTAPGVYEVRATVRTGTDGAECYFQKAIIRIDARSLSVAVRRAEGLEEFEARRFTTDMPLTVTAQGCAPSPY